MTKILTLKQIGSDGYAISDQLYYNQFNEINLQKTGPKLLAPRKNIINNMGTFIASIQYNDLQVQGEIFKIKTQKYQCQVMKSLRNQGLLSEFMK